MGDIFIVLCVIKSSLGGQTWKDTWGLANVLQYQPQLLPHTNKSPLFSRCTIPPISSIPDLIVPPPQQDIKALSADSVNLTFCQAFL